jgi:hypothetical protein
MYVVFKGRTLAFHILDVTFNTRHTQCRIFRMPSPFVVSHKVKTCCEFGLLVPTAVRTAQYAAGPLCRQLHLLDCHIIGRKMEIPLCGCSQLTFEFRLVKGAEASMVTNHT